MSDSEIVVNDGGDALGGTLSIPQHASGLVIFAHGSGSSRHSSRNRFVAQSLNAQSIATLLLDLLTPGEETIDSRTGSLRFDIPLLARRVTLASEWAREQPQFAKAPIGYFGASTGAGAALLAASVRDDIAATVSRGGRPDLAGPALAKVQAPTLLIVGERDEHVLELNRNAAAQMQARCEIAIVSHATHLFEEPGTLEEVARLAGAWFTGNF